MKIEPLEHKHRYRFRVRAVNKIGRSDPCEMLGDDILIKDPWGEFLAYIKLRVKLKKYIIIHLNCETYYSHPICTSLLNIVVLPKMT